MTTKRTALGLARRVFARDSSTERSSRRMERGIGGMDTGMSEHECVMCGHLIQDGEYLTCPHSPIVSGNITLDEKLQMADRIASLERKLVLAQAALRPFADAWRRWRDEGVRSEIRCDWLSRADEVLGTTGETVSLSDIRSDSDCTKPA